MQQGQSTVTKFASGIERAAQGGRSALYGLMKLNPGTYLAGATALLGAAIVKSIASFATFADQIQKNADAVGVDVEAFQRLQHAANKTGVQAQSVMNIMTRFTSKLEEARNGNLSLIDSFNKLGLSIYDLSKKTPDEALNAMLSRLRDLKQAGQDTNGIIEDLFGKKSVQDINKMIEGNFESEQGNAAIIDEEVIKQSVELVNAWTELKNSSTALAGELIKVSNAIAWMGKAVNVATSALNVMRSFPNSALQMGKMFIKNLIPFGTGGGNVIKDTMNMGKAIKADIDAANLKKGLEEAQKAAEAQKDEAQIAVDKEAQKAEAARQNRLYGYRKYNDVKGAALDQKSQAEIERANKNMDLADQRDSYAKFIQETGGVDENGKKISFEEYLKLLEKSVGIEEKRRKIEEQISKLNQKDADYAAKKEKLEKELLETEDEQYYSNKRKELERKKKLRWAQNTVKQTELVDSLESSKPPINTEQAMNQAWATAVENAKKQNIGLNDMQLERIGDVAKMDWILKNLSVFSPGKSSMDVFSNDLAKRGGFNSSVVVDKTDPTKQILEFVKLINDTEAQRNKDLSDLKALIGGK